MVTLNKSAVANAKSLIKSGKIDKDSPWSMDADEENKILGDNDWAEYGKWFLGIDQEAVVETKDRYKYPVGKDGTVFRSALIAIRQRAGQQKLTDIFDAAGELVDLIDDAGKENDNDGDEGKNGFFFDSRKISMFAQPWALMPECLSAMVMSARVASKEARPANIKQAPSQSGAIAILTISGVITQHPDWMGDCSVDGFLSDFYSSLNDPTVGAILIMIDSPGGSVYGIQEAFTAIMSARNVKPIVAVANSLAASAAYWLGCAASEFYCTPSGEVGSIGVWQAHVDVSGAMDQAGVNVTLISAGQYKVEGNPYEPLNDAALNFMQSRVDDYYGAFTSGVASGRDVDQDKVQSSMGQGRVLGAQDAKKQGMIDGVMTISQVVQMMQKRMTPAPQMRKASLEKAKQELAML